MTNNNPGNKTSNVEKDSRGDTTKSVQSVACSDEKSYRLIKTLHTEFAKMELDLVREAKSQGEIGSISVIIKVSEENYIPPGIKIRARISSQIVTADLQASDLNQLEKDPHVVSVSAAKRLRPL